MTITQTITALDGLTMPDPASQDQDAFDTNATAFATALPTLGDQMTELGSQMNTLAATMNAIAAGTAISIPYTFSTTTTDADPGAGILRLNNATQNAATTIRADLAGSDASDVTAFLDLLDDSTSTIKGFLMLRAIADSTKFLLFSVSAIASPAGYRNITVSNVASSAASPFADTDALVMEFTRNGDKGDTGATGSPGASGGLILLATLTPTAAANVDALSTFTASYDNYLIIGAGLVSAADNILRMRLANAGAADAGSNYYVGTTASTSVAVTATTTTAGIGANFAITIHNANSASQIKAVTGKSESQSAATPAYTATDVGAAYVAANAVTGVRFFWNSGANFVAQGSIRIYGYTNS